VVFAGVKVTLNICVPAANTVPFGTCVDANGKPTIPLSDAHGKITCNLQLDGLVGTSPIGAQYGYHFDTIAFPLTITPGPPGKITLMRMIELFTTGPEGVLNLNRGRLAIGSPADVTLFDTERSWTYDVNRSASKSRNSPFDGRVFRGGPVAAIVNGKVVWAADHVGLGVPAALQ